MATVVCVLGLASKRALLTYNDEAFQATCRCPRHIQYLYGQCYGQIDSCQKECHMTVSWAQVYNTIAWSMHQGLSLRFPCDDLTLT